MQFFALKSWIKAGVLPCVVLLAACSGTTTKKIGSSNATYAANTATIKICSGYECPIKDTLNVSADEQKKIRDLMQNGQAKSAKEERILISKTVAYFETIAQRSLRYAPDVEYSYQRHARKRGQMDCIDESLNTIEVLKYLKNQDLLKFHKPIRTFAERGLLVDGRYPHKSARMREIGGKDWAVDSWKGPNGSEPEIMPLKLWYRDRNSPSNYRS